MLAEKDSNHLLPSGGLQSHDFYDENKPLIIHSDAETVASHEIEIASVKGESTTLPERLANFIAALLISYPK